MCRAGFLLGRASKNPATVGIFIPIFHKIVEGSRLLQVRGILRAMDQTALLVTLFFTFILGAGIGFYVAKFIF